MKLFYTILLLLSLVPFFSSAQSDNTYTKNNGNETSTNFVAGAALNITSFTPSGPYKTAGGTSYTSYSPAVSFGVNLLANPNTGNLVFRAELMLGENHYNSAYTNKVSPYVPVKFSFDQLNYGIAPQVIYNFYNAEDFKIFAGIGLDFTFCHYSNTIFASQDASTPVSQILEDNHLFFKTFNTLMMFKAGIQFSKNWGIFADYQTSAPATRDPYFVVNLSSVQMGINYFFK
jgi:hypothetical protein